MIHMTTNQETKVMTDAIHEVGKFFLRKGYKPNDFNDDEVFFQALRENYWDVMQFIKDDWDGNQIECFKALINSVAPVLMCMVMHEKEIKANQEQN